MAPRALEEWQCETKLRHTAHLLTHLEINYNPCHITIWSFSRFVPMTLPSAPLPPNVFLFLFASPSLFSSETCWIKGHFGREGGGNNSSPLSLYSRSQSVGLHRQKAVRRSFIFTQINYFRVIVIICDVKVRLCSTISSLMAMLSEFHHLPSSPLS